MTHAPECAWERTTQAECEYRATHHYCPHPEHACTCPPAPVPTAMNCPPAWAGEHSDTFAYMLAGALSTVMLPDDQVMPTERIAEIIERVSQAGPNPSSEELA